MRKSGFTLIELLIVLTVMAILVGAMMPLFTSTKLTAQQAKAQGDLDSIKTAAIMYHNDTGTWPAGLVTDGLQTGAGFVTTDGTPGWNGPYLDKYDNDPWGTIATPRKYRMIWSSATTGSLTVATFGLPDASGGAAGTAAEDKTLLITPDRLK